MPFSLKVPWFFKSRRELFSSRRISSRKQVFRFSIFFSVCVVTRKVSNDLRLPLLDSNCYIAIKSCLAALIVHRFAY